MQCNDIQILISGYVDGELTQQEGQRVAAHVDSCARCQATFREVAALKGEMAALSWPNADEAMLVRLQADLVARSAGAFGWLLMLLGALILAGLALYGVITSPQVPSLVQIAYALFMFGILGLFFSVLRQRLVTYKNDKYRRVKL